MTVPAVAEAPPVVESPPLDAVPAAPEAAPVAVEAEPEIDHDALADAAFAEIHADEDEEPAVEPEAAEELPEVEEAPKIDPKGETRWKVEQLKRYRDAGKKAWDKVEAHREKLVAQTQELNQRAQQQNELDQLVRRDPEAALAHIAARAGLNPAEFYERLTQRRINDGEPTAADLTRRLEQMEHERNRERDEMRRQAEERQNSQQKQGLQQTRQRNIDAIMHMDPTHEGSYPAIMQLHRASKDMSNPDEQRYHDLGRREFFRVAQQAVDVAMRENIPLPNVAARLDKWVEANILRKSAGRPADALAQEAPPPAITNAVAATPVSPGRELTQEEHDAEADRLFSGAFDD